MCGVIHSSVLVDASDTYQGDGIGVGNNQAQDVLMLSVIMAVMNGSCITLPSSDQDKTLVFENGIAGS
jgi:hypothetical protein